MNDTKTKTINARIRLRMGLEVAHAAFMRATAEVAACDVGRQEDLETALSGVEYAFHAAKKLIPAYE